MDYFPDFLKRLADDDAVVVSIASTQGSVPREAGTWMAVFSSYIVGTIGGGHVEFEAIVEARALLKIAEKEPAQAEPYAKRYVLGSSLGQCCGGVMTLRYEKYSFSASEYAGYNQKITLNQVFDSNLPQKSVSQQQNVALFGGGHVGKAIVHILSTLPMQVMWLDSRGEIFPAELPHNVTCEHSDPVQAAVANLPAGSSVLIMSFSHAEDLDIVASCLKRQREKNDLPFIGLIGSKTKWATFRHRLEDRGFSEAELTHITCPIGVQGVKGKEPEVIAVSVATQLLQLRASTHS